MIRMDARWFVERSHRKRCDQLHGATGRDGGTKDGYSWGITKPASRGQFAALVEDCRVVWQGRQIELFPEAIQSCSSLIDLLSPPKADELNANGRSAGLSPARYTPSRAREARVFGPGIDDR